MAGTPNVRPPAGPFERRLDRALRYYRYAEKHGWTSDQVDGERAWLLEAYDLIDDAKAEAAERRKHREGGTRERRHQRR